ncbi:MAG: glycosyltransferase family 10 [archaeon]
MPKAKVAFKNFWREAKDSDNLYKRLLTENFDLEESENPDFVFYSSFADGKNTHKMEKITGNFTKIFCTGENIKINMKNTDWAFGFDYEDKIKNPKYMRVPLYAYYGAGNDLVKTKSKVNEALKSDRKFCNYTYSKDAKERVLFFKELSKYKKIDAPGKSQNNCPPIVPKNLYLLTKPIQIIESMAGKYPISSLISRHSQNWKEDKIDFLRNYKFTIAFENSEGEGYTTEKIYHPMLANSIPLYWGNPEIQRDFNTKSFVNYYDYNDFRKMADKVIDLDTNTKKYEKTLNKPWFNKNRPNKWCGKKRIITQLEKILQQKSRKQ